MLKQQRHQKRARRGAALVEFAVLMPLFLLFTVGMIEIGRALMVKQLITNASREGARVASYNTTTSTTTVSNAVNSYLSKSNISGATTTVSPASLATIASGEQVSVTVSIPCSQISWVPSSLFLGEANLAATSVMRRELKP